MESQTNDNSISNPLDAVARQRIVARLREAIELARDEWPDCLTRFRRLLEEASDQTEAWILARLDERAELSACEPDEYSMLARPDGDPLDEFLLIPFGDVRVERAVSGRSFVFERKHAESALRWFERIGRKLAIDYEHQSFERYNTRPDGLRPAAGWIGRLEARDDGLWACEVTWTERARELLHSGEYRYFSPVIFWTDEDYTDLDALGPVALTNDPAMRGVRPLAASRGGELPTNEEHEQSAESVLQGELDVLNDEIELLRKQLLAQEADTFVERGMRRGKIVESTGMDWRADYLRDPQATVARLERAPVLLPPGRVIKVDSRGEVTRDTARAEMTAGRKKLPGDVEAEDLAAYERAFASGRVLCR